MKTRMAFSFGLSALVLGGTMVGCTGGGGGIASASDRSGALADKAAGQNAGKAVKALAKRNAADAVRYAEAAVGLAPRNGAYRLLLGQAYLQSGRFGSARTAFTDTLALDPASGKAALNLALAQTATGDWDGARHTLDAHAAIIPVSDLGLAMALAGNPAGAVSLLTAAARTPGADAKTRQNLALALALSGEWNAARVVAAADLSPADVDARIEQWAAFAQPHGAADQVAALLGVKPAADPGLPVALALNAAVPVSPQAADPTATAQAEPGTPVAPPASGSVPADAWAPAPAAPRVAAVAEAPVAVAAPAPAATAVRFSAPREVAQSVPTIHAEPRPAKVAVSAMGAVRIAAVAPNARGAAKGDWYVQLGAYRNAGVAKDGWVRAQRRYAAFGGHQPTGTPFRSRGGSVYRLSIGGFSRADADRMCRSYRGQGGACFVRKAAGDQTAQWLARSVQVAAR